MHQGFMRGRAGVPAGVGVSASGRRTALRRLTMAMAMFAALVATAATATAQDQQPANGTLALLAPPDLSSPRSTLSTFRQSVDGAYAILIEAYDEYRTDPGFGVSPEVAAKVSEARLLLRRAIATLDLSQVAAVNRQKTGLETVLLLKEILDRLPPIPRDAAPGAEQVAAAEAAKSPIVDWRDPLFGSPHRPDRRRLESRSVRVFGEHGRTRVGILRFYQIAPAAPRRGGGFLRVLLAHAG